MIAFAARNRNTFSYYIMRILISPKPIRKKAHPAGLWSKIIDSPIAITGYLASKPTNTIGKHQRRGSSINHVNRRDAILSGIVNNSESRDNQSSIECQATEDIGTWVVKEVGKF